MNGSDSVQPDQSGRASEPEVDHPGPGHVDSGSLEERPDRQGASVGSGQGCEGVDEPLSGPRPKRAGLYYKMVDWLLEHQGSPHSVALGFAVGVFVALTPTVGLQMVIGATIAHFLRANRVIAAAMAWITNPATIVPIYYFNYRVGLFFLGGDPKQGRAFIGALANVSLLDFDRFLETMQVMLTKFAGIAGVLWFGSVIVGAVCGAISYPIVRRIVYVERCKLAAFQKKIAAKAAAK